jgi:hypothetical protein
MADTIIPEMIDKPLDEIVLKNGIDKKMEYELILQGLNYYEKAHCQRWWISFSDYVTWEDYKNKGYQHIADVVKDVHDHVQKATGKPVQLKLAFMPTEITRTSPFFPMGREEKVNRPLYNNFIIKNNWGTISVSGPKLSIQDESVLLAVLFLVKKYKSEKINTDYAELCQIMGISRGTNQYKAVEEGLERLAKAIVSTKLFDTKNLDKQDVVRSITGSILSNVDQKPKSTTVSITVNPYFLSLYGANMTTGIDLNVWSKLKGDVTKALYRFLESHKGSGGVPYGLATLVLAINLNTEQRLCDLRKLIRKSLAELQKNGIIQKWKMDKNDLVHLITKAITKK